MPVRKRVLIVEDDRVVKSSLSRLLENRDCHIESATSGEEGLSRFQQQPYDLVLTDLKLPDMDGMDMVQRMRVLAADLPFIVLTAFGDQADARRAVQMGAVDYLQKPLNAQHVLNVTQSAFQPHPSSPGAINPETAMKSPVNPDPSPNPEMVEQLMRLHGLLAPFGSIGRLGSGITHNLNGFLTGLMGHLELMKMKRPELSGELTGVLDLAKKIRDNVAELSNKFDHETQREPQPLDLNQILKAELGFLRAELFFKHYVAVRLDLQEPLPGVYGIYGDFSLAFEEILMNAVDAQRHQKQGEIRIKSFVQENLIFVTFEDAGPGFSPQALERALEPLWPQIKVTEEAQVRGGMGLFMVQRWLEPWGGDVLLSNCENGGGRVTVTLPKRARLPG
jgi:CheY-like chemotaxis protein